MSKEFSIWIKVTEKKTMCIFKNGKWIEDRHFKLFIYFNLRIITLLWWFLPCINMNQPQEFMCPLHPEPPSHLPPHPILPGCHRAWASGALVLTSNLQCFSVLHMPCICFSAILSNHPTLSFHWVQVCSSRPCLLCGPAHRIICTIFLDSIYVC